MKFSPCASARHPGSPACNIPTLEQFKCSGYADDTTVAATSDASIEETFTIYGQFERASGARLNRGKSKGMWAGSWKDRSDKPYGLGKAVVINTLALSQICHVFTIPRWATKRITKAVWSFFWSGKDLVKRSTVCLPKSQGGFGVINFEQKAQAFALQWIKRYFDPERSKWKDFFTFFVSSGLQFDPRNTLARYFIARRLAPLPPYYQLIFRAWQALDGSLSDDGALVLGKHSDVPLALENFSSRSVSGLLRQASHVEPSCQVHFRPTYGQFHWSQTWAQLHICTLDRPVIDLNWKIAHGVLYTGAHLANDFHMAHVSPRCFCAADDETLEHLFFECELARLLVAWVYFNLMSCHPTARRFTVEELLFGFSAERRRAIPLIIIYMLQVMKHTIWVARCDFRFRQKKPIVHVCLNKPIAKLKFVLGLLGRRCETVAQIRPFEREWLARGTLRGGAGLLLLKCSIYFF